jgi:hypothetical protein
MRPFSLFLTTLFQIMTVIFLGACSNIGGSSGSHATMSSTTIPNTTSTTTSGTMGTDGAMLITSELTQLAQSPQTDITVVFNQVNVSAGFSPTAALSGPAAILSPSPVTIDSLPLTLAYTTSLKDGTKCLAMAQDAQTNSRPFTIYGAATLVATNDIGEIVIQATQIDYGFQQSPIFSNSTAGVLLTSIYNCTEGAAVIGPQQPSAASVWTIVTETQSCAVARNCPSYNIVSNGILTQPNTQAYYQITSTELAALNSAATAVYQSAFINNPNQSGPCETVTNTPGQTDYLTMQGSQPRLPSSIPAGVEYSVGSAGESTVYSNFGGNACYSTDAALIDSLHQIMQELANKYLLGQLTVAH